MKKLTLVALLLATVPAYAQAPTVIEGGTAVMPADQAGSVDIQGSEKWYGNDAKAQRYITFVARDKNEWEFLWTEQLKRSPPVALPKGRMGVAVFLGNRPNVNYSVRIAGARMEGETLQVTYLENKPTVLTPMPGDTPVSPWVIQLMPINDGGVRFFPAINHAAGK